MIKTNLSNHARPRTIPFSFTDYTLQNIQYNPCSMTLTVQFISSIHHNGNHLQFPFIKSIIIIFRTLHKHMDKMWHHIEWNTYSLSLLHTHSLSISLSLFHAHTHTHTHTYTHTHTPELHLYVLQKVEVGCIILQILQHIMVCNKRW